jgi:outer membrane protein OmpA-like peptidoglycan-associated protein
MAERNPELLDTARRGFAWTAGAVACALAATAMAQTARDVDPRRPVTVDLGVLDQLGPPPTVPGLLLPTMPRAEEAPLPSGPAVRRPPQPRLRLPNVNRPPPLVGPAAPTAPPASEPIKLRPPRRVTRPATAPSPPPHKPMDLVTTTPPEAKPPAPPAARQESPRRQTDVARRETPPAAAAPPARRAPAMPEGVPPPPPPLESTAPPRPPSAAPPTTVATRAPSTRPAQKAAPPRAPAADSGTVRLIFDPSTDDLTDDNTRMLAPQIATLEHDEELKLRIVAYAGGKGGSSISARRMSLSRALAVRSYLMDRGISASRLEVRALGNRSQDGPPDRVDTTVVPR